MAKKMNCFRVFHGTCADAQLALIAKHRNLPRATVLGFWLALQEIASNNMPRGSLKGCSPESLALVLDMPVADAAGLFDDMTACKIINPVSGVKDWLRKQHHSTERVRQFRQKEPTRAKRPHHDDPDEVRKRRARLSATPRPSAPAARLGKD